MADCRNCTSCTEVSFQGFLYMHFSYYVVIKSPLPPVQTIVFVMWAYNYLFYIFQKYFYCSILSYQLVVPNLNFLSCVFFNRLVASSVMCLIITSPFIIILVLTALKIDFISTSSFTSRFVAPVTIDTTRLSRSNLMLHWLPLVLG